MSSPIASALLGASTFCASQHGTDECDSKGLPLTPHSFNIIGRFQVLKGLHHPSLCAYLNIFKSKNERLIIVSEYYDDCLENHIKSGRFSSPKTMCRVAWQVLQGLAYLNERGITHRGLSPSNILVTPEGRVKLHGFGVYHITKHGTAISFPIGSPRYMAPETIMSGPKSASPSSPKVDVWSLGVILLELFMRTPVYPDLFLRNALNTLFKRIMLLVHNHQRHAVTPLAALLEVHGCAEKPMEAQLHSFLDSCLTPLPSKRPTPSEHLLHPFLSEATSRQPRPGQNGYQFLPSPFSALTRCQALELPDHTPTGSLPSHAPNSATPTLKEDHLSERSLQEVYYLWSLAGGDPEVELKRAGIIRSRPPICNLPCLVLPEGEAHGLAKDRVTLFDDSVLILSLEQLRVRLEGLTTEDYYPLLEKIDGDEPLPTSQRHESSKLPMAIKERDVEYQFHRMILFSRLLESYPYTRDHIVSEAAIDICPLMRAEIWAALLGVKGDIHSQYTAIDKDTDSPTDRQIAVDIPRCHQYNVLLASSEGHRKFKRVLKSWVVSHPHLVYWQGLDSLCAPFLSLNFNNEPLAFAGLTAFISKYLHNFFKRDNSPTMQEYLAVFSHMIAFHDPVLFNHLDSITFFPELYAIPWFLTMFTHILPLNKIYHLWDTMLLGNCSFPICVGVAILQLLRTDLLSLVFNECILMFSDMPDIDIEQCVQDSIRVFRATPPSTLLRRHEHMPTQDPSIPPEARREPLPLVTLKAESCPQISAHDLITLCRLESHAIGYGNQPRGEGKSPLRTTPLPQQGKGGKKKRQRAIVVDIRTQEEFRLGHVPNSVNLPHTSVLQPNGSLTPSPAAATLTAHRGRVVIVVANKGEAAPIFARQLVRLEFPKVCVLQGGAGMLRSLGLLSSIQDDI